MRYFLKLPAWFTVDTPIGPYNPDWALVYEDTQRVYLVRETKGSLDPAQRRHDENVKILCAQHHFGTMGIDFAVTTSVRETISGLARSGQP